MSNLNSKIWILHEVVNFKKKKSSIWPPLSEISASWNPVARSTVNSTPARWFVGGISAPFSPTNGFGYTKTGNSVTLNSYRLRPSTTVARLNYLTEVFNTAAKLLAGKINTSAFKSSTDGYVSCGNEETSPSIYITMYYDADSGDGAGYPDTIPGTNIAWNYTSDTQKINYSTATSSNSSTANLSLPFAFASGMETSSNPTNNGYVFGGYYQGPAPDGGPYSYAPNYSYIHKLSYSTDSFTTLSTRLPGSGRDSFGCDGDGSTKGYIIGGYTSTTSDTSAITKFTFSTDTPTNSSSLHKNIVDIGLVTAPAPYGMAVYAGGHDTNSFIVGGYPIFPAAYSNYAKIVFSTDTSSVITTATLIAIPPANNPLNINGPGGGQGSRGYVQGVGGGSNYGYFSYGHSNFAFQPAPEAVSVGSYVWYETERFTWSSETNEYSSSATWKYASSILGGQGASSFSE